MVISARIVDLQLDLCAFDSHLARVDVKNRRSISIIKLIIDVVMDNAWLSNWRVTNKNHFDLFGPALLTQLFDESFDLLLRILPVSFLNEVVEDKAALSDFFSC